MTGNQIYQPRFVFDLQIKLLKKDSSDESGFRLRFAHQVLQSGMISEDNDLGIDQVRSKFFQDKGNH